MIYILKLKPDRDITGLLPIIFCLLIPALVGALMGPVAGFSTMAGIIFIYSFFCIFAVYRTKSIGYIVLTCYMFSMFLYILSLDINIYSGRLIYQTPESKFFLFTSFFLALWMLYLTFTKKNKWRGREILELAACKVEEGINTYTDRPRPVNKMEFQREEVEYFAKFLVKSLIIMPYYEQERILFVPVRNGHEYPYLFGSNINYWNKTWVAFDFDGNISAHISKNDYLDYKKNLEFDPLCEELGKLFVEFFEYFRQGEEVRIIDKLNEVKVGYFS
ncbi:MAG: hypothetical protein C0412_11880 [Flavobacterium sp.]|nr:hypothetical protein [Flavobacterium sp.]